MHIRPYVPDDAERLAMVYREAVRMLGREHYDEAQRAVWARHADDATALGASLAQGLTLCAVVVGAPAAFGQLHPVDHIAYLYCHPAQARRGLASTILNRLEARARAEGVEVLRVEASCVARPLFERRGFHLVEAEYPVREGVTFQRFRMAKPLRPEAKGAG